jgi:hypothetical protein
MRISRVAVALIVAAVGSAPAIALGGFQVEKGTLYLQPGGTVLLRTEQEIVLSKGRNVLAPVAVPPYVALEKLSVGFPDKEADVTLSEAELQKDSAEEQANPASQRLAIVAESRIGGRAKLSLVYPAKNLGWFAENECKLPAGDDTAYLQLRLCFVNDSEIALADMRVLVPESGHAPVGVAREGPGSVPYSAIARAAPGPAPEPIGLSYGANMFELGRPFSIGPSGKKSVVVGKWAISPKPGYVEIRSRFTGSPPVLGACLTEGDSWRQVSMAARRILRFEPGPHAEPLRLLPGRVLLTSYGETLLTYLDAESWSKQDSLVLISWPTDDVNLRHNQASFREIYKGRACSEKIVLTVKNARDTRQQVRVREPLFRSTKFSVLSASLPCNIATDGTIEFQLDIEPKQETSIEYEIRYDAT